MPNSSVMRLCLLFALLTAAIGMAACSDSKVRAPSPTAPTPPAQPMPTVPLQIFSATVAPPLCVPGMTMLQADVQAFGSNNDTLTYAWTSNNGTFADTPHASFECGGQTNLQGVYSPVTITVADHQGHSMKQNVS